MNPYRIISTAGLAAFVLAGCGTSSTASPQQAVETYFSDVASGEYRDACKLLTTDVWHELSSGSPSSCEQALEEQNKENADSEQDAREARVSAGGVTVTGDSASVVMEPANLQPHPPAGTPGIVELTRRNGAWILGKIEEAIGAAEPSGG